MKLPNWIPWPRDQPRNRLGGGFSFLFGGTPSGQVVSERSAMQLTAVYSCVRILAEAVATLPLHLFKRTEDGGKEPAYNHPLYQILYNEPNDDMNSFVFRETLMSHLLIWGNAYAQITRNGRGQVTGLYPLLPNKMEVSRAANGELVYTYYRDWDEIAEQRKGAIITLRRDDVLHIPGLGFDGLIGYSPIAMARNTIGIALATEDYASRFFANSATPSGVLEAPMPIANKEKLRKDWHTQFSGANSHNIAVLEDGLKFHQMSLNNTDAQFIESRRFQMEEIARIFRVPNHLLGDLEKSSFNNIENQSLSFVKYTLDPWVSRWEKSMQQRLLLPSEKRDYIIRMNLEGLLRGDLKSRYDSYAVGIQNGFMSPNDVRGIEDWNLIPDEEGGNGHYVNGNMLPLHLAQQGAYVKEQVIKEETE
ncbi:portal protein [Clostridia bacterium]|nr:portal protein [Clostridia bacterium]